MRNARADRRSSRTRQLLSDAMIALMMEKPYDSITVQDIIDRANVGRSTFYAHYQDKDDLLSGQFGRLIEELSENTGHEREGSNPIMPSLDLFRHIEKHYPLYKALVWGRGLDFVVKSIQALLSASIEKRLTLLVRKSVSPPVPLRLVANYIAGTFLTVLQWWLDNGMEPSPERLDEQFQRLVIPGVEAALDLKL